MAATYFGAGEVEAGRRPRLTLKLVSPCEGPPASLHVRVGSFILSLAEEGRHVMAPPWQDARRVLVVAELAA